jgi:MFS family permease
MANLPSSTTSPAAPPASKPPASLNFIQRFTVLWGAVRELWIVFGYITLSNVAYAMVNLSLTVWLSADLGYSDIKAGLTVTCWSGLMTLSIVMVGSLTDAMGLRKTFLLGCSLCLIARVFMSFTTLPLLALGCGLAVLAVGEALGAPVTVAALRRYTTTRQRSIAFSIFYAIMNLGFGLAGCLFDAVRKVVGKGKQVHLLGLDLHFSSYQTIFLLSMLFYAVTLVVVYFWVREGVDVTDEGVQITPAKPKYPESPMVEAFWFSVRDTARETLRIFAGLWKQPGFYKFLAFLSLAAFVKMIFVHMNYTYPKFGLRELGPDAPIGKLWALNPFLIVPLVPLVGVLTQRVSAYRMAICGSFVAASSVFVMALPPQLFQALADGWLGDRIAHSWLGVPGPVNPYYVMIFLFVVLLSCGEAIYSPRLYEYAAAIAPKGQEASYMALSHIPMFLAKMAMASFSGVLLAHLCPECGPRHSDKLWLIIALMTMIAPIGLFAFRRLIRVHEAGRDE